MGSEHGAADWRLRARPPRGPPRDPPKGPPRGPILRSPTRAGASVPREGRLREARRAQAAAAAANAAMEAEDVAIQCALSRPDAVENALGFLDAPAGAGADALQAAELEKAAVFLAAWGKGDEAAAARDAAAAVRAGAPDREAQLRRYWDLASAGTTQTQWEWDPGDDAPGDDVSEPVLS